MAESVAVRYNLVVLPVSSRTAGEQRFELSAGAPGHPRLISPAWTETEVRSALSGAGLPFSHVQQLLRGNAMVFGGRTQKPRFFSAGQLAGMGLREAPPPVAEDMAYVGTAR